MKAEEDSIRELMGGTSEPLSGHAKAAADASPSPQPTAPRPLARHAAVPSHRASRLLKLGRLAGGLAGGMMAEGVKRLAAGERPKMGDLLLTPANANRVADRLSELRGAAMKVGQLMSMEAGEFLPPELTSVLARLRDKAHIMPLGEVAKVLRANWGAGWEQQFRRFNFTPIAAASIGQVHEAETKDGRRLAIKLQYPGVRKSIDSDVNNVATLLSLTGALPKELDLKPLLEEAKRQLHEEADYRREAEHLRHYTRLLHGDERFVVPELIEELTTADVLAMSFLPGDSIDSVATAPQSVRDRVGTDLVELALREVFQWGLVQTDPNFSNYLYDAESGRIGLLDFGASRPYDLAHTDRFRRLTLAAAARDREALETLAAEVGYLGGDEGEEYRDAVAQLLYDAVEPVRLAGPYDYGSTSLATRMGENVRVMRLERRYWRLPPPELLFLHRKLGGLYLICSKLRSRVDVAGIMQQLEQERLAAA